MGDRIYTYHGRLVHQTEKAWLADLDVHPEEVWLPKSEVEYGDGVFDIPDKVVRMKDLPKPKGPW